MSKHYWAENSQVADMKIAKMVDLVFIRLMEYHTEDKRNKAVGLSDVVTLETAMKSWAREFALMTPDMISRGGRKIKEQRFCPNLAQFVQMCKPSAEEAYAEAQAGMQARSRGEFGVWTCPAVFYAAQAFGGMDLKTSDWFKASARFSKIYERMIEKQEAGELSEIPAAVSVDMRLEDSRDEVRNHEKVDPMIKRALTSFKPKPSQQWAVMPRSLFAVNEMLSRVKSGMLDVAVLNVNIEAGTVIADGEKFRPVGYYQHGEVVLI